MYQVMQSHSLTYNMTVFFLVAFIIGACFGSLLTHVVYMSDRKKQTTYRGWLRANGHLPRHYYYDTCGNDDARGLWITLVRMVYTKYEPHLISTLRDNRCLARLVVHSSHDRGDRRTTGAIPRATLPRLQRVVLYSMAATLYGRRQLSSIPEIPDYSIEAGTPSRLAVATATRCSISRERSRGSRGD